MKRFILMLALFLGLCTGALAQPKPFVIANSEIVPLRSTSTGQAHELVIVYPDSYATSPNKTYPVLYFLDAYWDTPQMVSAYGNLRFDKMVPEFIMVGLSNPEGSDHRETGMRDYTYTSLAFVPGSGKGEQFLQFIEKEVAPLIETKYRGQKENRVLAGTSLGGLFTLGTALKDPDFFNGYIALSPALLWDNGAIFDMEEAFAKLKRSIKARMFISVGALEPVQFRESVAKFEQRIASRPYKGLELQTYVMPELSHGTVKGEGYIRGLKWVWQNRQ